MKCGNKSIISIWLIGLILIFTGCWDNRDIAELNIVSAVGIDKASDGQYELTVQVIKTSAISAREQGSSEEAVWTISKTGETIFEAVRNLLSTVGKRPLYSHTELIVFGEDVARDGLMDVLDFFERDHETRRRAYVLVAKGITAKEIVKAKSEREPIPALHISSTIETVNGLPQKRKLEIIQLLQEIGSKGRETVIGVIFPLCDIGPEVMINDLDVNGGAIFKGDKLIGWLEPREMRGYLFAVNEVESGLMVIPNPQSADDKVSIEIKSVDSQIDVKFSEGSPALSIDIKLEGNIGDQQGNGDLTKPDMVSALEQAYQQAVLDEVVYVVTLAQELKCDIFGFGEKMHQKHLGYWSSVKDDWNSQFAELPVNITVKANIKKPGLVKQPVEAAS